MIPNQVVPTSPPYPGAGTPATSKLFHEEASLLVSSANVPEKEARAGDNDPTEPRRKKAKIDDWFRLAQRSAVVSMTGAGETRLRSRITPTESSPLAPLTVIQTEPSQLGRNSPTRPIDQDDVLQSPIMMQEDWSTTKQELLEVSPEVARATISRLVEGYKDKSGSNYPKASINLSGCLLAQKPPNRAENGYVQIAPLSTGNRGTKGIRTAKPKPQNAHRLVVIGWKSAQDRRLLLEQGFHASHLCHEPTCIKPEHIVVESRKDNESRKACKLSYLSGFQSEGGVSRECWRSSHECPHEPMCIRRALVGEVIL